MADEEVYENVTNHPSNLENAIFTTINNKRTTGNFSPENFEYLVQKSPLNLLDYTYY